MKLPYTAVLTLFLNSAVSAKKTGAGDDHTMIRNLLAKVDAQDAKMAVYDAKIDELNEKNAKLEALLLGAPRVPQGKKNLRHRGLREDDANVDFAAILMDFSTTEEKTEDMIAHLGLASVLKTLIMEMNPVLNCLTYDQVSQTCTLGSDETNTVDIIAEEDIDVTAIEGGDIKIEAVEGDVDIFAGDAGSGGNITISALSANTDDDLGQISIEGLKGVEIVSDDGDVLIEAAGEIGIEAAGEIGIETDGGNINLDAFEKPTGGGNVNIGADIDIDIVAGVGDEKGDIFIEAGDDDDESVVFIRATNDVTIEAGADFLGQATNNGGDINLEAFAGTGPTPPGGNVAVKTDGDGDFTVDGTVVPFVP